MAAVQCCTGRAEDGIAIASTVQYIVVSFMGMGFGSLHIVGPPTVVGAKVWKYNVALYDRTN